MTGRTHAALGAATWTVLAPTIVSSASLGEVFLGAVLCAGGALLPDLDHARSRATRSGGWVTRALSLGVRTAAGGHRGATHSLAAVAVLWMGLSLVVDRLLPTGAPWIAEAVAVGALSHVLADGVTRGGVPAAWPLSSLRMGIGLMRSGGVGDRLLGVVCTVVLGIAALRAVLGR